MLADNSEQIAEWNGPLGERWVAMQQEIDRIVVPFGDAALKVAAPQPGERVIDIGCGCGDTSIEHCAVVGATGSVLGIDVSQPMLEVARSRGAQADCPHLAFRNSDASEAELPSNVDLLFSRFGVMFFSEPAAAFSHLRKSLRTGAGACSFAGVRRATTRGQ
jgi:ubiquinone/menaquinone biosynthesis C-methylase UbiE